MFNQLFIMKNHNEGSTIIHQMIIGILILF